MLAPISGVSFSLENGLPGTNLTRKKVIVISTQIVISDIRSLLKIYFTNYFTPFIFEFGYVVDVSYNNSIF